jgi:hypothetical protein
MPDGRNLFMKFLHRETIPRPVIIPFIDTLAARISGNSYREMIGDPGLWAAALSKSMELLGTDGIIAGFDGTILAQALGATISWSDGVPAVAGPAAGVTDDPLATPHLAAALETVKRLSAIPGRRGWACVAAAAGPLTLAAQVFAPAEIEAGITRIKPRITAVTEAFLKTQPDMFLFVEQLRHDQVKSFGSVARVYNTLRNLAGYYHVPVAVFVEGYDPAAVHELLTLKLDIIILGRDCYHDGPELAAAMQLAHEVAGVGIGIPWDQPARAGNIMQEAVAACHDGQQLLLTSLGGLNRDIDLNAVRTLIDGCRVNEMETGA